jgi:hypothetical protein
MIAAPVACAVKPAQRTAPKKWLGKRPGALSKELQATYANAADSHSNPGIRVQLGRRMSVLYAPTTHVPDKETDGALPEASVELAWAYGYNGANGKANLFLNADGDATYSIAGIAVVC